MNISVIVLGTIAASFGEMKFVLSGFVYQIFGLVFEAYRLALTQQLLSSGQEMKPIVALYYYAPVSAVMSGLIAVIGDGAFPSWSAIVNVGLPMLIANAVVAFLFDVLSVTLVRSISPPTAGPLKKIGCKDIFAGVNAMRGH